MVSITKRTVRWRHDKSERAALIDQLFINTRRASMLPCLTIEWQRSTVWREIWIVNSAGFREENDELIGVPVTTS